MTTQMQAQSEVGIVRSDQQRCTIWPYVLEPFRLTVVGNLQQVEDVWPVFSVNYLIVNFVGVLNHRSLATASRY